MANYPKRKPKPAKKDNETLLEELELFQEWRKQIMPELREMLLKKVPAKEILKKYEPQAAARLVTIALTDPDNGRAMAAADKIQDRVSGKPTENKNITHGMSQLTDQQLDALLRTEMEEMGITDEDLKELQ